MARSESDILAEKICMGIAGVCGWGAYLLFTGLAVSFVVWSVISAPIFIAFLCVILSVAGWGSISALAGVATFGDKIDAWLRRRHQAPTSNTAFDEWKSSEIEKIKLAQAALNKAEENFTAFLADLKRAKDKQEFQQFLASHGQ